MKRIFIVGVARSGTTLLQSLLANHQDIYTFPETHFFSYTIPKPRLLRLIHKINPEHRIIIKNFLEQEGKASVFSPYQGGVRNLNQWTSYLLSTLDSMCSDAGKDTWLEKTPMHLHYIDLIRRNCRDCYFIHMIREPFSTIAALYHVGKKYPDSFAQHTIEKAIKRYKNEIMISEEYLNRPGHTHIHYEDLVQQPEKTIRELCAFLDLEFRSELLEHDKAVDHIVMKDEAWKDNNRKTLQLQNKIRERVDEEEFDLIKNSLSGFNPKLLEYYGKD